VVSSHHYLVLPPASFIIQEGPAIGPAAYAVNARDRTSAVPGNSLIIILKIADNTYLRIPASNEASRDIELTNIRNGGVRIFKLGGISPFPSHSFLSLSFPVSLRVPLSPVTLILYR